MRDLLVRQLAALGVDAARPPYAGLSDHALRQILLAVRPRKGLTDVPTADGDPLSDPWVRRTAQNIPLLRAVLSRPEPDVRSAARAFSTNFDLLPGGPAKAASIDSESDALLSDPWVRRAAKQIPSLRPAVEAAEETGLWSLSGEEDLRESGPQVRPRAFGEKYEEAKHPRDEKGRWAEKGNEKAGQVGPPAEANPLPANTPVYQVKFDKNRIDRSAVWNAIRSGKAIPEKDDWYKKTEYLQQHTVPQGSRGVRTTYEKKTREAGEGLVTYSEVTDDGMLHTVVLAPVVEHYGGRSYDPKGTSYYKVVAEQHLPLGISGDAIATERQRLTGKDYARRLMERYHEREKVKRQDEQDARGYAFLEGVLQGALHALPGGSTADIAVHGGSNEDLTFAVLGDIASIAGPIGIAVKGTRAGKAIFVAAQGLDGGLAATRAVQAVQAYNRGDAAKGDAYLSETFLRLAGMTVNQVGWTKAGPRTPKEEPHSPKGEGPSFANTKPMYRPLSAEAEAETKALIEKIAEQNGAPPAAGSRWPEQSGTFKDGYRYNKVLTSEELVRLSELEQSEFEMVIYKNQTVLLRKGPAIGDKVPLDPRTGRNPAGVSVGGAFPDPENVVGLIHTHPSGAPARLRNRPSQDDMMRGEVLPNLKRSAKYIATRNMKGEVRLIPVHNQP